MAYIPSAIETTRPVDADIAETAQLEFRTMKAFYHGNLGKAAATTINNNSVLNAILSVVIPAGALGTDREFKFVAKGWIVNATGAAANTLFSLTFGGAGLGGVAAAIPGNGTFALRVEMSLKNRGAANQQAGFFEIFVYATPSHNASAAVLQMSGAQIDGAAIDTTLAQTATFSLQQSVASVNYSTVIDSMYLHWMN